MILRFEYEHKSKIFDITVKENKYYPTRESMFQIFLGVQNRSSLNSVQLHSVKKIIVVNWLEQFWLKFF